MSPQLALLIPKTEPDRTEPHRPREILAVLRGELVAEGRALQEAERRDGMQAPSTFAKRREWLALLAGYESYAGEFGEGE